MRVVSILILITVLIAIYWTIDDGSRDEDQERSPERSDEPDVYGQRIQFNQLKPDGSLHYRMFADAIRQYDGQQLTYMDAPFLHLRSPQQPPWDIRSIKGSITNQETAQGVTEEVVYLQDNVRMVQEHPERGTVTLRSESFYLYPDREYAETTQNVTIDTEVGRTVAAGMSTDMQTGVITLSSNATQRVHTIVLPDQFKKS